MIIMEINERKTSRSFPDKDDVSDDAIRNSSVCWGLDHTVLGSGSHCVDLFQLTLGDRDDAGKRNFYGYASLALFPWYGTYNLPLFLFFFRK